MKHLRYLIAPLLIWALFFLKANIYFRVYPVVMTAIMLVVFTVSLWRTPVIEVFARKFGNTLDDRGISYCRKVTFVWIGFFIVNLIISICTLFTDIDCWAFYNGFLSYVLMGILFAGEWLYRKLVLHV